MANLPALKDKEAMLVAKLARLNSGEMNCTEREGDNRQEEAISRSDKFLREVRKEIASLEQSATPKK